MAVTAPAVAERQTEARQAAQARSVTAIADQVRQTVTAVVLRAGEKVWNEIAGVLIADALDMETEGRLSFYDFHRQRNADRNPIAEAGEFMIGDYPTSGGGTGPGGEFKIKLIELANGGRWSLYPRLEVFGEGADALRRAIAAGLLEALEPVARSEDFGRRLIALGFVDRSDAELPRREPASACSASQMVADHD
jgi:hypothetical protein